jgi:fibronectin-binding autotransporter adhesin
MSKNTNLSFLTDFLTADIVNSRVGMNNVSPQSTFDVTGTGKFSGILTLGSTVSNGTYTYTLPSATGTLALTSDIPSVSGYVPYTGATQAVNLGYNSLSASFLRIDGAGPTLGSYLGFKHSTNVTTGADGYTSIYTFGTNTIAFKSISGATTRDFSFSMASITPGVPGGRTYTLPDADGTIALTSNLSGYLPLTGGTLTGALNGTTATFSTSTNGIVTVNRSSTSFASLFKMSTAGVDNWSIGIPTLSSADWVLFNHASGISNLSFASATGAATFSSALNGTTANFSGNVTMGGNDGFSTRLYVRTEDAANTPSLTLFKNITSASSEDIFRVQSWNGAFNTVASIRANGSANFLSSVSATSLRSSTVGTFGFNTASNGEFQIYSTAESGLVMAGRGSSFDMVITNKNGADTIRIPTGTINVNFLGSVTAGGQITGPSGSTESKFNFLGYNNAYGGIAANTGFNPNYNGVTIYSNYNSTRNGQGNTSNPSWALDLGGSIPDPDSFGVFRSPAGSFTFSNLFKITSAGNVLIGLSTDNGYKLYVNGLVGTSSSVTATNYISNTQGLNVSGYGFYTQTISGQMTIIGHNVSASSSVANQTNVINSGWYSSMIKMYYSEGITFHTSSTVYSAGAVYPMGDTERVRIQTDGQVRFQSSIILTNGQINSLTSGGSGQSMYLNFGGNGAIYAGSSYAVLYAGSDERIKTEINHSQSTLTRILNLIPRTFKYKERPDVTNYGFIAQEVEKVMPELVRVSEGITMCLDEEIENQKSVESYGLAWASILVKAIQEQQQQIQELKNKLS